MPTATAAAPVSDTQLAKIRKRAAAEWEAFNVSLLQLDRIYLWGAPGLGKTYAALHSRKQREGDVHPAVVNATLSDDVVLQELMGHYMPKGGEFVWHDGPVSEAMRNGSLLVLNELARASAAVKDAMLGVLDNNGSLQIPLPSGEVLRANKGFQIVATANSDTDDLDPALADRFEAVLHVTLPHPDLTQALDQFLPGLGGAVERSYLDTERRITPRSAMSYGKLVRAGVGIKLASQIAFGDRSTDIRAVLTLAGVSA